jgi:hypothetical protein
MKRREAAAPQQRAKRSRKEAQVAAHHGPQSSASGALPFYLRLTNASFTAA